MIYKNKIFPVCCLLFTVYLQAQDINTVAGNGIGSYCGDNNPATSACLNWSKGIDVDRHGSVYIADRSNNRIRKVNPFGIITTIAGTGTAGFNGDGITAITAQLNVPSGVALDKFGNIYIADESNFRIRKVDTFGIITTISGTGVSGFNGDNIVASTAQITHVVDLTLDTGNNIYFSDGDNYRIRKINSLGIITSVAGTGTAGFSGDGGLAIAAQYNGANGIATDKKGNIYFCDFYNNRIRMIDTNGLINTIAGDGGTGYGGDGGSATMAQIYQPLDIAIDNLNNLFIAGGFSNNIRRFKVNGIISTVAGTGAAGFSGDGGPAISAQFNVPIGIAVDTIGAVYITDVGNNRIRKIDNSVGIKENASNKKQLTVYPNPNSGEMYISGNNITDTEWNVEVKDLTGRLLFKQALPIDKGMARLKTDLPNGAYFITVKGSYGNPVTQKIIVNN